MGNSLHRYLISRPDANLVYCINPTDQSYHTHLQILSRCNILFPVHDCTGLSCFFHVAFLRVYQDGVSFPVTHHRWNGLSSRLSEAIR